ncbi:MAG: hypothetical protein NTX52_04290 [Planctomycetota bacterium]|nr:hypothetical protein [Planctomycetota bacterium]
MAAPKEATETLVSEIRSRISSVWAKTRGRDGHRQAAFIGKELDSVLQSIGSIIEKGCYLEAEKVLVRYIEAAEKFGVEVDDSYGYLWPVCQAGITLWGKVWTKIKPRDRIKLSELIYLHVHNNTNGLKDDIIIDFKDALGNEGLQHLKGKLLKDYMELPDSKKYTLCWQLENIADALNDVDFFIEVNQMKGNVSRDAIPIARRLYEAKRYEEALAYLGKADYFQFSDEPYDYATLKSKILVALGRGDEALRTLWSDFTQHLSSSTLENILLLSDNGQYDQVRQKAYKTAIEHRDIYNAMSFLTQQGQLIATANLIQQRQSEISGQAYNSVLSVAERLKEKFPAQAWILYKALTTNILESSRYKAYGHAADYVKIMSQLSQQAEIETQQTEFLEYLKQKHGRKSSFWERLGSID